MIATDSHKTTTYVSSTRFNEEYEFCGALFLVTKKRNRLTRNRIDRATPDAKTEERTVFLTGDYGQGNGVRERTLYLWRN